MASSPRRCVALYGCNTCTSSTLQREKRNRQGVPRRGFSSTTMRRKYGASASVSSPSGIDLPGRSVCAAFFHYALQLCCNGPFLLFRRDEEASSRCRSFVTHQIRIRRALIARENGARLTELTVQLDNEFWSGLSEFFSAMLFSFFLYFFYKLTIARQTRQDGKLSLTKPSSGIRRTIRSFSSNSRNTRTHRLPTTF